MSELQTKEERQIERFMYLSFETLLRDTLGAFNVGIMQQHFLASPRGYFMSLNQGMYEVMKAFDEWLKIQEQFKDTDDKPDYEQTNALRLACGQLAVTLMMLAYVHGGLGDPSYDPSTQAFNAHEVRESAINTFVLNVAKMRKAQHAYFKTRDKGALLLALNCEANVDSSIDHLRDMYRIGLD